MRILFCSNPLNNKEVDMDYLSEYKVAKNMGFNVSLIDFEELVMNNNPIVAISQVPEMESKELDVFRGWMMKPMKYEILYDALLSKNIELVNTPISYKHCHYLPESYSLIEEYTPKTIWINENDLDKDLKNINEYLKVFDSNPIIVKDYVKSRKHEWLEACYIPKASDINNATKVVRKFIELQGDEFNEGIVFREFVDLEFLSYHPQSNMPLSKEFRIFFINNQPIYVVNYWDEGEYGDLKPNIEKFLKVAKSIKSKLFTMDVAKIKDGDWVIMELGDGQVSGLPDNANLEDFYQCIKGAEAKFKSL